jgi:GDPmannose 4,6-dehydratase
MRALICGISGQDGAYLAKFLLDKGYEVFGSSRDAQASSFLGLKTLGIFDRVKTLSLAGNDFRSVLQAIKTIAPNEVYNLSGQSSVGLSFEQPVETMESIATATLNFLEAIRFAGKEIKFYNAGSSECFGDTEGAPADETTPFRPRSPYAVAKSAAHWQVNNYRQAYNLFACTGILFNHESPLRSERFVTKKIITAAKRISQGAKERLKLGNIQISRDWGWAPEYVEAMWMMLQQKTPDDFVIATGETNKLEKFVSEAFSLGGLDWKKHVDTDNSLLRPTDLMIGRANPERAQKVLGWQPKYRMSEVVRMMYEHSSN